MCGLIKVQGPSLRIGAQKIENVNKAQAGWHECVLEYTVIFAFAMITITFWAVGFPGIGHDYAI